jgi:large subunit ribosomal protein L13
MTTYMAKANEVEKKWYILDATNKPLGRLATEAARLLRGKHKPTFTPHIDSGDHVIVINAEKVILTGKKLEQKMTFRHSGYPGGVKQMNYKTLMQVNPEKAVELAVTGMLPHNKLGDKIAKKLKVYKGTEHGHEAQMPVIWEIQA